MAQGPPLWGRGARFSSEEAGVGALEGDVCLHRGTALRVTDGRLAPTALHLGIASEACPAMNGWCTMGQPGPFLSCQSHPSKSLRPFSLEIPNHHSSPLPRFLPSQARAAPGAWPTSRPNERREGECPQRISLPPSPPSPPQAIPIFSSSSLLFKANV